MLTQRWKDKPTSTIAAVVSAIAAILAWVSAYNSNTRAEQLFMEQIRPLVGVTPIAVRQRPENQTEIYYSITNYSGFPAKNITINLKYGGHDWINEWLKANSNATATAANDGVVMDHFYISHPTNYLIPFIKAGESHTSTGPGMPPYTRGALTLETEVCNLSDGLPISIWLTWENEHGHVFSKINEYKLRCTKGAGSAGPSSARAFTFLPKAQS